MQEQEEKMQALPEKMQALPEKRMSPSDFLGVLSSSLFMSHFLQFVVDIKEEQDVKCCEKHRIHLLVSLYWVY